MGDAEAWRCLLPCICSTCQSCCVNPQQVPPWPVGTTDQSRALVTLSAFWYPLSLKPQPLTGRRRVLLCLGLNKLYQGSKELGRRMTCFILFHFPPVVAFFAMSDKHRKNQCLLVNESVLCERVSESIQSAPLLTASTQGPTWVQVSHVLCNFLFGNMMGRCKEEFITYQSQSCFFSVKQEKGDLQ